MIVRKYYNLIIAIILFFLLGFLSWLSVFDYRLSAGILFVCLLSWFVWRDLYNGWKLLLFSILCGQLIRISLGEANVLVSDGIVVLFIGIWLIKKMVTGKKIKFDISWWWVLGFIGVSSLINLYLSQFYDAGTNKTMWLYLVRLVVYLGILPVSISLSKEFDLFGRAWKSWWKTMIIFVALGLIQLIFVPNIAFMVKYGWDPHVGRLLSTFLDPNFAGALIAFCFSIAWCIFVFEKKWTKDKLNWLLVSGLMALSLVLTLSRSALVGWAVSFGILSWWKDKKWLLLALLVGSVLVFSNQRMQERIFGIVKVDETAQMRIESWEENISIARDNYWLGVGYNTLVYNKYIKGMIVDKTVHSASGSDSSYLMIWSTLGIIGLLTWLLGWIWMLSYLFRIMFDIGYPNRYIAGGVGFGLISLLIHAQFTNSLMYAHIILPVLMVIGIVIGDYYRHINIKRGKA